MTREEGAARTRATVVGLSAVLMWSTLALLTAASGATPPFLLNALCFGLAGLLALGALLARGRGLGALRQPPKVWAVGVGGLFGYHFLYFTALEAPRRSPPNLLNYLWPLLIVLLSGPAARRTPLKAHHAWPGRRWGSPAPPADRGRRRRVAEQRAPWPRLSAAALGRGRDLGPAIPCCRQPPWPRCRPTRVAASAWGTAALTHWSATWPSKPTVWPQGGRPVGGDPGHGPCSVGAAFYSSGTTGSSAATSRCWARPACDAAAVDQPACCWPATRRPS